MFRRTQVPQKESLAEFPPVVLDATPTLKRAEFSFSKKVSACAIGLLKLSPRLQLAREALDCSITREARAKYCSFIAASGTSKDLATLISKKQYLSDEDLTDGSNVIPASLQQKIAHRLSTLRFPKLFVPLILSAVMAVGPISSIGILTQYNENLGLSIYRQYRKLPSIRVFDNTFHVAPWDFAVLLVVALSYSSAAKAHSLSKRFLNISNFTDPDARLELKKEE